MALGARTWYPARDERSGVYQLQKAEARAALEHEVQMRKMERLREIRMRHDLRHGTPLGAAHNLAPGHFSAGAAHHPLCNTAGIQSLSPRSPPKIGMPMPATQLGAHGLANNGQKVKQAGQSQSSAQHDIGQGQNKHQNSTNQGFAHGNQNGSPQNGNHQKTGDKQNFGNQQPQHSANQQNGNQRGSGVRQNSNQSSFENQQSFGARNGDHRSLGNQHTGNERTVERQESFGARNGDHRSLGNQQTGNQRTVERQESFGARDGDHRSLGNQQIGNQRTTENQKNTGIPQKFGAQQGFNSIQRSDSRQGGGMDQRCYSRNGDHGHIYSKISNTDLSPMKHGQRDASQPTSFGSEDLNELHSKIGFGQSPQRPTISKVTYVPSPTYIDDAQSFQPRVHSRGELHAGDRVNLNQLVTGGGKGWNGFSSEPLHVQSHDHYDYLLGKEISRVLSLANVSPGGISYGHRRSFSGF